MNFNILSTIQCLSIDQLCVVLTMENFQDEREDLYFTSEKCFVNFFLSSSVFNQLVFIITNNKDIQKEFKSLKIYSKKDQCKFLLKKIWNKNKELFLKNC